MTGDPTDSPTGRPLLATRLAVAPLPSGPVVPRRRLFALLDSGVRAAVTLVLAPAGWGKTVLLSSWCRERTGTGRERTGTTARPGPIRWLSVEPADDGARLWPYLSRALRPDGPDGPDGPDSFDGPDPDGPDLPGNAPGPDPLGDTLSVILDGPAGADFLEHLADELSRRDEPVILIIDDFHRIADPAFPEGLEFLLRHTGQRLRLVIAARTEPPLALHRWRLAGELTEIRPTDLAFTPDEAGDLLAADGAPTGTGDLVDLVDLVERTEGWAAGLRFAALALRGQPDPAGFAARFGGDQPDVAGYLAKEVLAGLPVEIRETLARLSVADRFPADLVDALTGRGDGADLLAAVAGSTGFLLADGGQPPGYRFHRMLGDLLRADLARRPRAEVVELHRRAATWSAEHGQPADALRHTLCAGRWRQAAELLLDRWPELLPYRAGGGRSAAVPDPPPAEVLNGDPEAGLAYAADRLAARDLAAAGHHLRLAGEREAALAAGRRIRFRRISDLLHLALAELAGDLPELRSRAARLLDAVPEDDSSADASALRAVTRAIRGAAHLGNGALTLAESEFAAATADAELAGLDRLVRACAGPRALVLALWGRLRLADDLARGADGSAPARLALAVVALHRDRLGEAETGLLAAMRAAYPDPDPAIAVIAPLVRARISSDRGDLCAAYQALRAGRRHLTDRPGDPDLGHWFTALEADLRTAHGEPAGARDALLPAVRHGSGPVEVLAVALARAELHAGDPRAAARTVPDWAAPEAAAWPPVVRLEAGLLDAVAARATQDHRRAARILEQLLRLAEPEGHRRVFSRAEPPVRDLLTAHLDSGTAYWATVTELIGADNRRAAGDAPPQNVPALGEPLTERELTILRYLQSILSNVEIAAELSLSINTVKTHVRNIYRKLDASRRREAVRRARELRLL